MKHLFLLITLFLLGCDYPKDPEHSFEEARNENLKVGVTLNPPFTDNTNGTLSGTEIDLLEEFARKNNLQIQYTVDSESNLIKKMENYDIHIIAGGFDKKTIWKKKAGLSAPYNKKKVFLVARGENKLLQNLERFIFSKTKK